MQRKVFKFIRNVGLALGLVFFLVWFFITQPSLLSNKRIELNVSEARLQAVVRRLSVDFYPRNFESSENLINAATYIRDHFQEAGGKVEIQEFSANGRQYQNVRCFFGNLNSPRIIIGAHYDTHNLTPGADDNASGVAGLIELAYLFGKTPPTSCIELVAYTLEEPPFFGSKQMGSYIHAQSLGQEGVTIRGMIALEMIGYFSEEANSQSYPSKLLKILYPSTGDFIAIAGNIDQRSYIAEVKRGMKGATTLDVRSISAPQQLPGIDFSDHRNYWLFGYDAVMITDTAFYRNSAYHTPNDTWDTLDYVKMADVVRMVYNYLAHEGQ